MLALPRNLPTWNLNSDLEDEILVKAFKHTRKRIRPKVSESLTFICLIRFTTIFIIVVVRFKGVGNAPIMKQNMYKITATNRFQAVIQFLRKELGWLAPDDTVLNLFKVSRLFV